jgi:hypothetical protein
MVTGIDRWRWAIPGCQGVGKAPLNAPGLACPGDFSGVYFNGIPAAGVNVFIFPAAMA